MISIALQRAGFYAERLAPGHHTEVQKVEEQFGWKPAPAHLRTGVERLMNAKQRCSQTSCLRKPSSLRQELALSQAAALMQQSLRASSNFTLQAYHRCAASRSCTSSSMHSRRFVDAVSLTCRSTNVPRRIVGSWRFTLTRNGESPSASRKRLPERGFSRARARARLSSELRRPCKAWSTAVTESGAQNTSE